MLRSSRYLKLNKSKLTSFPATRHFNYQKEIYINDFDCVGDKKLAAQVTNSRASNPNLYRYINAYHKYGFKLAKLDPLGLTNFDSHVDELDPAVYGLSGTASKFNVDNLLFKPDSSQLDVTEIEAYLKRHYSSNCAIEFDHLQNEEEKLWLAKEFEAVNSKTLENNVKLDLLKLLLKSQVI